MRSWDKEERKGRRVLIHISLDQVLFISSSSSKRCAVRWEKDNELGHMCQQDLFKRTKLNSELEPETAAHPQVTW